MTAHAGPTALAATLERLCPGYVIDPGHRLYPRLTRLFNGLHDPRPAAVVLPGDTAQVCAVAATLAAAGTPTAVRSSGHNVSGAASVDGGVVVDLRRLARVDIDPVREVAVVGGGATWGQFDAAAARCGLATTGGTFDTTGVAGLTLGGGIGHLMGRYGLSCDNVRSFELVTSHGELRRVDPSTDPDLDWALRGAGHNFGVVTGFEFDLHPVEEVYGGYVVYPADVLAPAVRLWRDVAASAPDELTVILLLERFGPSQVPAAVMSVCYCGDDTGAVERLEAWLRSLPVLDWQLERRLYLTMQQVLGRLRYGLRHYWSGRFVDELPDDLVDALVEAFLASRRTGTFNDTLYLEAFGGAMARVPSEATAVPFRGRRFNVTGMAIWEDPAADAEQRAWARSVSRLAEARGGPGDGYVNYVSDAGHAAPVRRDRVSTTFGTDRLARLAEVKRRLDPTNFFRGNYNVVPSGSPDGMASEARVEVPVGGGDPVA